MAWFRSSGPKHSDSGEQAKGSRSPLPDQDFEHARGGSSVNNSMIDIGSSGRHSKEGGLWAEGRDLAALLRDTAVGGRQRRAAGVRAPKENPHIKGHYREGVEDQKYFREV